MHRGFDWKKLMRRADNDGTMGFENGSPDHVRGREREMLLVTAAVVFEAIDPIGDAVVGRRGAPAASRRQ